MNSGGLVSSVRQRLLNLAKENGEPFDYVLIRYGIERFLYRLSVSKWAGSFILKGAMLFRIWDYGTHRQTRDLDLLGTLSDQPQAVESAILDVIRTKAPDDALWFDEESLTAEEIREATSYGGIRVKMTIRMGNIKIPLQVDIGFGDVVFPAAEVREFPALLPEFPKATLSTYPVYTVIAEKLEALVILDAQNSRMKDFLDLWILTGSREIERIQLSAAINATFTRRKTPLPLTIPTGLTEAFARMKEPMWQAFLMKNGLGKNVGTLVDVVIRIASNLPAEWRNAP